LVGSLFNLIVECGEAEDGLPKQYCPSVDVNGIWHCVDGTAVQIATVETIF